MHFLQHLKISIPWQNMEVGEASVSRKDPFQGTPNDYLKNQQIPCKTFKNICKIFIFIEPCT